jgi:hypothetical protein
MEVSVQLHDPAVLLWEEESLGTHCIGGWRGGPGAGLDALDETTFDGLIPFGFLSVTYNPFFAKKEN